MEITYSARAEADIEFWKQTGNRKMMQRISSLLNDIEQNPFSGLGKPEPLKHQLAGCWSRRIDKVHRLVYRVAANEIEVVSLRFHY